MKRLMFRDTNLASPAPISPHPPQPFLSHKEREGADSPLPMGEGHGVRANAPLSHSVGEGQGVRATPLSHSVGAGQGVRATPLSHSVGAGQGVRANAPLSHSVGAGLGVRATPLSHSVGAGQGVRAKTVSREKRLVDSGIKCLLLLLHTLILSAHAQQLPVRDDPLYDLQARQSPSPASLLRVPRSADEFVFEQGNPETAYARWKTGQQRSLSEVEPILILVLDGFGYPDGSDWRTAEASYRIVGLIPVGEGALLEVVASDARRLSGGNPSAFDTLALARLTLQTGEFRWQIGRANLRWDGGYSGGLLVNDEIPPVPYASVQFDWRLPYIGTWRFEQFLSQFEQDGKTVWWGARRFSRSLGTRWEVSLGEAFKALSLPDGLTSQIVPYYLYQKWLSDSRRQSGWFNYLAEVGVQYRLNESDRVYLFWLIDDIRAPDLLGGRGANTPRKTALLIGTRFKPTPDTRLVLELVRTDGTRDGGTYGDSGHDPRYAYSYESLSMGHPFGPNQVGFYGRLDWQNEEWAVAVEHLNRRRFHDFRSGERGTMWNLQVGYQVNPTSLVVLQYRSERMRDGGMADPKAGWWLWVRTQF